MNTPKNFLSCGSLAGRPQNAGLLAIKGQRAVLGETRVLECPELREAEDAHVSCRTTPPRPAVVHAHDDGRASSRSPDLEFSTASRPPTPAPWCQMTRPKVSPTSKKISRYPVAARRGASRPPEIPEARLEPVELAVEEARSHGDKKTGQIISL